jgi:hypothetical protein
MPDAYLNLESAERLGHPESQGARTQLFTNLKVALLECPVLYIDTSAILGIVGVHQTNNGIIQYTQDERHFQEMLGQNHSLQEKMYRFLVKADGYRITTRVLGELETKAQELKTVNGKLPLQNHKSWEPKVGAYFTGAAERILKFVAATRKRRYGHVQPRSKESDDGTLAVAKRYPDRLSANSPLADASIIYWMTKEVLAGRKAAILCDDRKLLASLWEEIKDKVDEHTMPLVLNSNPGYGISTLKGEMSVIANMEAAESLDIALRSLG